MATRTTTQAGNWSSLATWGGTVPVAGDSVVVNHALTLDVSFSGIAGWTQDANVVDSGTGRTFGFAANATLTIGSVNQSITLTIGPGNTIAGIPGSQAVCTIGDRFLPGNSAVVFAGTAGSLAAARDIRFTVGGFPGGGVVRASYFLFLRCGDPTNPAINTYQNTNPNPVQLYHGTCDTCGNFGHSGQLFSSDTFDVRDCVWVNTPAGVTPLRISTSNAAPTGIWQVIDSTFDAPPSLSYSYYLTWERNKFFAGLGIGPGRWASCRENLLVTAAEPSTPIYGDFIDFYSYVGPTSPNPNFLQNQDTTGSTILLDGLALEYAGIDGSGDGIFLNNNPSSVLTYTIRRTIIPPNAGGQDSCSPVTTGVAPNVRIAFEHNTYLMGGQGFLNGAQQPGQITSFRGNLAWDTSVRGFKTWDATAASANPPADQIVAGACDYNGGWKYSTSRPLGTSLPNVNGYVGNFSVAPGAHDINADPQFFAPTRGLLAWDAHLSGTTGSVAHILQQFQARDPNYTVAALLAWVRAGFAPTNVAFKDASYPGDPISADLGAVPFLVGSGPTRYTLAGPKILDLGSAGTFTVTLDAPAASGVTFTPRDGGQGGVFTPTSVTVASGATTATFTYAPAAPGTVTIATTNTGGFSDAPGLTYVVTRFGQFKPIWEANMQGPKRTSWLASASPAPLVGMDGAGHYDPTGVYEALRRYTGDTTFDQQIAVALYQQRDLYVLPTGGSIPGHHNFALGQRDHFVRTGDVTSRAAAILMAANGAEATDGSPLDYCADFGASRECALSILSYLGAEDCGAAHRPRLDHYIRLALGHCDQWLVAPASRPPCWYIQPFMVGITLRALIEYWDRYRDGGVDTTVTPNVAVTGIPAKVKAVLDLLWTGSFAIPGGPTVPFWNPDQHNAVVPGGYGTGPDGTGAFGYSIPGAAYNAGCASNTNDGSGYPTASLNMFVAPAYHWYYQFSGDDTYRQRGDAVFCGSIACVPQSPTDPEIPFFAEKEFHQCYWWSTASPAWRSRLASAPPRATGLSLTLVDSAGGPANVPSGRIVVALAGGGSVTRPVTVTLHDSAGSRFLPPRVRLTTDDVSLVTRIVPPAAAANTTITFWTTNDGGLTDHAPVSYAVGPAVPLATGYTVTPPASSNAVNVPSPPITIALAPPGSVPPVGADNDGGIIVVDFGDSYAGGFFNPLHDWLAAERTSSGMAYTPTSSPPHTIWTSNSAGLPTPAGLVYVAGSGPNTFAATGATGLGLAGSGVVAHGPRSRPVSGSSGLGLSGVASSSRSRPVAGMGVLGLSSVANSPIAIAVAASGRIALSGSGSGFDGLAQVFSVSASGHLALVVAGSGASYDTDHLFDGSFLFDAGPLFDDASATYRLQGTTRINLSGVGLPVDLLDVNLGRFQRGEKIALTLLTVGVPDAPPVATIAIGGVTVAAFEIPMVPPGDMRHFGMTLRPWGGMILGTYRVTYTYSVGGVLHAASQAFDLVGGGDSGGEVISLYCYDRPEGRYVVAQLGAGKLVQGRNPRL